MERGRLWSTRTALIIGFSTAWLSVALIGCGGSTGEIGGAPSPFQPPGSIGVAGGQVSSADGRATLTVPANALTTDTVFTIAPANGAPSSPRIVGPVFDVEPTGTTFVANTPARLTLAYDPLPVGVDAATLRLGTVVNGVWVTVTDSPTDTVIDAANRTVTAPIPHLSLYAVLQPAAASDPTNHAPIASAGGPYLGTVNQLLTLYAAGSTDQDGDALTYTWTFGDASAPNTTAAQLITHAYQAAGTYSATLTVNDGRGAAATATADVTITAPPPVNQPPTANATIPPTGVVNQPVAFTGTGSDPDGDPLAYSWNFGDGSTTSPTAATNHTYTTAGTFSVTFTVNDGHGGVGTVLGTIVIGTPQSPTAVSQQYTISQRQSAPQYYWRYAITLNGTGVPPLTFRIVSFPTHLATDVYKGNVPSGMDMIVNTLYQWWDPATTSWRGECLAADPSCYATASSHVDLTPDPLTGLPKGDVSVDPSNSPVTVIYTPVLCWAWSGPLTDSFSFVVTDATGATSEPATISFVVSTNATCHGPSF